MTATLLEEKAADAASSDAQGTKSTVTAKTVAKPVASLNAGLLARKGEARPSLSQQTKVLADAGIVAASVPPASPGFDAVHGDSAGRSRAENPALVQVRKRPEPEKSTSEQMPNITSEECLTGMARVSFRMPMSDFLRLKMAGAMLERPSKEILLEALELYLDKHEIGRLDNCRCIQVSSGQASSGQDCSDGEERIA